MKIGVMTPTYNRPDCARLLVLQMENQTLQPDVVCIHQNGSRRSYEWAVADIDHRFTLQWLHSPEQLAQDDWYIRPLEALIRHNCDVFFWCDHDDFYDRNHIARTVDLLSGASGESYDFVVNAFASILYLKKPYEYVPSVSFRNAHAPGGMSSSMGFNRPFALALLDDLKANLQSGTHHYSDQVVAKVTKPKFRCYTDESQRPTTTYIAHEGAVSSASWVRDQEVYRGPLSNTADALNWPGVRLLGHIANIGDVTSDQTLSLRGGNRPVGGIQGFELLDANNDLLGQLEYRARLLSGDWTEWADCNVYVGTRSKGENLTGYSLRQKTGTPNRWSITLMGRFSSNADFTSVAAGEDCVPTNPGELLGMQILFRPLP